MKLLKVTQKNHTPFNDSLFKPYYYEFSDLITLITVSILFVFTYKM